MSVNLVITEYIIFRKFKETPEIFCIVDDFCKFYDALMAKYTFKAQRGKCSNGMVLRMQATFDMQREELLNFMIMSGDVDDRKPLEYNAFVNLTYGKLVGDKGYIGKNLFEKLFVDGIQLITKLKNNMKGAMMSVSDKVLLRKRAIIETMNNELKNIAQVEHSRHRCFDNFMVNLLGALSAYCFFPKKPTIRVEPVDCMNDRQPTFILKYFRRTHVKHI